MKYRYLILLVLTFSGSLQAQDAPRDAEGYESFQMPDGDTVYTMKKYYMVFLKEGAVRDQDPKEAAFIQQQHMAHINKMAEEGYVIMAGPFDDDSEVSGILIFNAKSEEKVKELSEQDPAVKAGRLVVEVHPWWAAKGSQLR